MKIAYFDCFSGVSGDKVLGALIDAGLDLKKLKRELNKLKIPYKLKIKKVKKSDIVGSKVDISTVSRARRRPSHFIKILRKSELDDEVKELCEKMFNRLAKAEAKIHNKPVKTTHFHELGKMDTIIEIVGAVLGIKLMGVEKIYASPIPIGKGFISCEKKILPAPAPATMELVKGIPVYGKYIENELTTPTGAVIITSLAESFTELPQMRIERIGYGAGSKELTIPNMLRFFVGESTKKDSLLRDTTTIIETNIDDMSPELYEHVINRLFQKGALDVFLTPVQMKNNRPGVKLSVLADKNLTELIDIIFTETTTLGVRSYEVKRFELEREERVIETKYGKIKFKIGKYNGKIKNIAPEYRDCLSIAEKKSIPLKEVYQEVQKSLGAKRYLCTQKTNKKKIMRGGIASLAI